MDDNLVLFVVFSSVGREDLTFRFPLTEEGRESTIDTPFSEACASIGSSVASGRAGLWLGVLSSGGVGEVKFAAGTEFKFSLLRLCVDQSPCIDLLRVFGPLLQLCKRERID